MKTKTKILLVLLVIQSFLIFGYDAAKEKKEKKGKGVAAPAAKKGKGVPITGLPEVLKKGKGVDTGKKGKGIDGSEGEGSLEAPAGEVPLADMAPVVEAPPGPENPQVEGLTAPEPAPAPESPPPAPESPPPVKESPPPAKESPPPANIKAADNQDEDADPVPDPFSQNKKWSAFVNRVDAITAQLTDIVNPLAKLLDPSNADYSANKETYLKEFSKGFTKTFVTLNDFFEPLHSELWDGAAYTIVNPAIGLTNLKKLNEWARNPPAKTLDKARLKWIEVNGMAITVHYIFDRINKEIEKWGLGEVQDSVSIGYPTWLQTISGYEGEDKATYELKQLQDLSGIINFEIDAQGEKGHMMRSLEKILRKHLSGWDPDSDYNIYCFGNNEFGVIHDVFDLLTDAALYLSMADMKHAVVNATWHVFKEWEAQTGGGDDGDAAKVSAPSDIAPKIAGIFEDMKTRINRKIRIGTIIPTADNIVPGPTTFKCDKPPGEKDEESPNQPPGHNPIPKDGDEVRPPRIPPGGKPPVFPAAQWGKPAPKPLTPKSKGPTPLLDPQSGPEHPDPVGYIDKRPSDFEYASFSQAYMGYLEAEMVLNPDGSCKSTCPDFRRPVNTCQNKPSIDCPELRNSFCEPGKNCMEKSKCDKNAKKCIRTSYDVSFCPSAKQDRIYDWIDINGTLVGKQTNDGQKNCDNEVFKLKERWEMDFGIILNTPQYCEVCLCVCDSPMSEAGIHHFDIQPVVAAEGNVITSVKFTQKDNVIRLEAEQGKVLPNGKVDQDSVAWIESPPPSKGDASKTVQLAGDGGFRKLGLDMVYATTQEVITGIKFVLVGDTLHLSVQTTKIDLNTGALLSPAESAWKDPNFPAPDPKPTIIGLEDKVSSSKQLGPSQPRYIPDNKNVVLFEASSLPLDAGQAVIPFFDIQAVRHHTVRKPLNAIGLLYKTKKGFGGFVSPTVTPWRKFFL